MLALPKHIPSSNPPSQVIGELVLELLRLPSLKEFIRCIYLIRPQKLVLNQVVFDEDNLDTYMITPPPHRHRTSPSKGCATYINGIPLDRLSLPSYCTFMALMYASRDADINRARATVAQSIPQLFKCITSASTIHISTTKLASKYVPRGSTGSNAYHEFGGTASNRVSADATFQVDEQTGLVDVGVVEIHLPTGVASQPSPATSIDFDRLDRLLTELVNAPAPPIRISYSNDVDMNNASHRDSIKPLLRAILDDEQALSQVLARVSRTRRITLQSGKYIISVLKELLPVPLQSSVIGWQHMLDDKDGLRINWIFEVLRSAWSAEDLQSALHALDPSRRA
ncbi:hypothetical protein PsYK624_100380 [Phanerochaete sordida]|uniref:Uncharacterized protein n=1 Tax=Phanerochaete sordida TaxID=48140 RepID=A0A9P3GD23_9APHY|nr:hypothetical protein PsYK624_100380 [Phanerochaete sordida]